MHTQIADDWFVGFNTGLKAKFWRAASEPWADDDAQAIAALLDLSARSRVLDAPCGAGRIAVRLAERGLDVTGIDISEEEVREGRRVAAARGIRARFEHGDLRALPEGGFDAVVCWGNSFGYLPHEGTVEHLASTHRALRAGGSFLLESMTVAESLLPAFHAEIEHEAGGVTMVARHVYDGPRSRLLGDFTFSDRQGRTERGPVIHHVYTAAEVVRLLEGAGFRVDHVLGDAARRTPYELGAKRLVALCKRI